MITPALGLGEIRPTDALRIVRRAAQSPLTLERHAIAAHPLPMHCRTEITVLY